MVIEVDLQICCFKTLNHLTRNLTQQCHSSRTAQAEHTLQVVRKRLKYAAGVVLEEDAYLHVPLFSGVSCVFLGPFPLSWRHTQQERVLSALWLWVMVTGKNGGTGRRHRWGLRTKAWLGSSLSFMCLLLIFFKAEYSIYPKQIFPTSWTVSASPAWFGLIHFGFWSLEYRVTSLMSTPCLVWVQPSSLWSFWIPFTASQGTAFLFKFYQLS